MSKQISQAEVIQKIRLALNCADADLQGMIQRERLESDPSKLDIKSARLTRDAITDALSLVESIAAANPVEIAIHVSGGVVTDVISTCPDTKVHLCDTDGDDELELEDKETAGDRWDKLINGPDKYYFVA